MGFATAVLLLAVAHAGLGVACARRTTTFGRTVVAATGAATASTGAAVVVMRLAMTEFDFFAFAHVVYLMLTVTLPLLAAAGWVARLRRRRGRFAGTGAAVLLGVGLLPAPVGLYATHVEPGRLRVDHQVLEAEPIAGTVRVGVFADLQTPSIGAREHEAMRLLLDQRPDVILVPGDLWQMADADIESRWPDFRALVEQMTTAVDHVVVVEGDTDHVAWLRRVVDGTGAHLLEDTTVELHIRGSTVLVAGLLNDDGERPAPQAGADRAHALTRLADAADHTFTLVLAHRPDVAIDPAVQAASPDLVVAGHTHGGQVQLPFIGPLITFSAVPREVAAGGLHRLDDIDLYVSTGIGLERGHAPQVRFLAPPSVGVVDLVALTD